MPSRQSPARQNLGEGTDDRVTCLKFPLRTFQERMFEFKMPNYGAIQEGLIYRCSYPQPENYDSIKYLQINTIVTLVGEELPDPYMDFLLENHIRHHQITVPANKDGLISVTPQLMLDILKLVANSNNYPLLIHCNRGKHRTGCVTACFRKVQGYSSSDALHEYSTYAHPKQRPDDIAFIESFDPEPVLTHIRDMGLKLPRPLADISAPRIVSREQGSDFLLPVKKKITDGYAKAAADPPGDVSS